MAINTNLLPDGDLLNPSPYPRAQYNAIPFRGSVLINGSLGTTFGSWTSPKQMVGLAYAQDPSVVNYTGLPATNPNRQTLSLNYPNSTGQVMLEGTAYTRFNALRSGTILVSMYLARKPDIKNVQYTGTPELLFCVEKEPGQTGTFPPAGLSAGPYAVPAIGLWRQITYTYQIITGPQALYLRVGSAGYIYQADDGAIITHMSVTYPYDVIGTLVSPSVQEVTTPAGAPFPSLTMHFEENQGVRTAITSSPVAFGLENVTPAGGILFVNNQYQRINGTTDAKLGDYTIASGQIRGVTQGATGTLVGQMNDGTVIRVPLRVTGSVTPPVDNEGPYYVSVFNDPAKPRCDRQDAIVNTYFAPLQATVLDQKRQAVGSGTIIFNDGGSGSTAILAPTGEQRVQVLSGLATQANVKALGKVDSRDYGVAYVNAYPLDLSGKSLSSVSADRYATYILRVWESMSAIVTSTSGTPQTTKPNTVFAQQLKAKVTESNGASVVPDLLVNFMILGSRATFELSTATVEPTSTPSQAVVRTDASGIATSPKILAGPDEDTVTVLAKTIVSTTPASFTLNIKNDDIPPPTGDYMYDLLPLSGKPATVDLNAWNMLDWQVWDYETGSVASGSVKCDITLQNANGTQLSFSQTTSQTTTTVTSSAGTLEVPVFGGTVQASGATITAQVDGNQSAPSVVPIVFR
ncbi:hypothetical protein [Bordetella sp. N]|uniref:hypothetical protein n=1 Tax=Bordetella sp. N TaxID=1746199 RepID=UPI00070AA11E|nr:hypothetical protein [Bordetella sp. N]ALM84794.1 hypothetical protein ASB57_19070 [Bordetella sp. N]